jgi:hypothetical protein
MKVETRVTEEDEGIEKNHKSKKREEKIQMQNLSLSLSLYFVEREALHPFCKIHCFPTFSSLLPPPFLFSSFLTSSSLSPCLSGFLGLSIYWV